jgi:SAM-dependent methyltransferase
MPDNTAADPDTLAFYDREAKSYAARAKPAHNKRLEAYLGQLPKGAKILELGCGGGQDSEAMIRLGFDVTPTDGSPGLAAEAEKRLGRPVKILRFADLDEQLAYDGVWASACLLHVPADRLGDVLAKIHAALRHGGRFYASYKMGEGDGGSRDNLGRYYNFPSREKLAATYQQAGTWTSVATEEAPGGGYDGVPRTFLHVMAVKA